MLYSEKEIMELLEKSLGQKFDSLEEAIKSLGKKPEKTELEKQLDNFLGTEQTQKIEQAKNQFLSLSKVKQAEFKKSNPALYEAMFPTEEINIPKPSNYEAEKALIMKSEGKDISKLSYGSRLYAHHHDAEFNAFIQVADASLKAKQGSGSNPLFKGKYKAQ
jgi:hypothetical protein